MAARAHLMTAVPARHVAARLALTAVAQAHLAPALASAAQLAPPARPQARVRGCDNLVLGVKVKSHILENDVRHGSRSGRVACPDTCRRPCLAHVYTQAGDRDLVHV